MGRHSEVLPSPRREIAQRVIVVSAAATQRISHARSALSYFTTARLEQHASSFQWLAADDPLQNELLNLPQLPWQSVWFSQ
jgi:hypothetical protein